MRLRRRGAAKRLAFHATSTCRPMPSNEPLDGTQMIGRPVENSISSANE